MILLWFLQDHTHSILGSGMQYAAEYKEVHTQPVATRCRDFDICGRTWHHQYV